MATTTPNFGWAVPTSTDLVKDGAVAIETLGDAIDASLLDLKGGTTGQVLKKNTNTDMDFIWSADSAGMTNPMTTTGDTIYSSSGSTPARLGIGSTGNVLTVAGGVPTWSAPAGGGQNFTLLNTGGTALSGSTLTISGLSGYGSLFLILDTATTNANATIGLRLNTDTASNYRYSGQTSNSLTSYSMGIFSGGYASTTYIPIASLSNGSSAFYGGVEIKGANSTGIKVITTKGSPGGVNGDVGFDNYGVYVGTSVISSLSLICTSNSFDYGTVYLYGSAV